MASNTPPTAFAASAASTTSSRPFNIQNHPQARMINSGGIPSARKSTPSPTYDPSISAQISRLEAQYTRHGTKSLSGIALRAFVLGLVLALSSISTIYLVTRHNALWRIPFFLSALSTFHFLEFWTTAAYNAPSAAVSSFLLSSNGAAYNIAHASAMLECLLSHTLLRSFLPALPQWASTALLVSGFALLALGQVVRSVAMVQAGTNFNHVVQTTKNREHRLVEHGIYSVLRHPSYFGFFWWGLGTQLVLGNVLCFVGYAGVLWRFFERRIEGEEKFLVSFFGDEYLAYRKRTIIGIPFI